MNERMTRTLPVTPGDVWERIDYCCRTSDTGDVKVLIGIMECMFNSVIETNKRRRFNFVKTDLKVRGYDIALVGYGLCEYVFDKANGEYGYDAMAFATVLEKCLKDCKPSSASVDIAVNFERGEWQNAGSRAAFSDYFSVCVPEIYATSVRSRVSYLNGE